MNSQNLICGCGEPAVVELRFPNVERYKGTGPIWQPMCHRCYMVHLANFEDTYRHEMEHFGGRYGVPEFEERPVVAGLNEFDLSLISV